MQGGRTLVQTAFMATSGGPARGLVSVAALNGGIPTGQGCGASPSFVGTDRGAAVSRRSAAACLVAV